MTITVAPRGAVAALLAALLSAVPVPALVLVPDCPGDCDGDGVVSVAELVGGVAIALGNARADACPSLDADGDATVSIGELITAIANATGGCAAKPPILRPRSAAPGTMLTIIHPAIVGGRALPVTFRDARGYVLTVATPLTEDGLAEIAVPPLLDLDSGEFVAGAVAVTIPGAADGQLEIAALPEVGVEPGVLVELLLGEAADRLATAAQGAERLADETGHVSPTLREGLRAGTGFVSELAVEVMRDGRIALGTPNGVAVLDAEHLGLLDRLLAAPLLAVAALPLADGAGRRASLPLAPPTTREGWADVVEALKSSIPGMQVLGSYVSVLTGVVGLVAAAVPGGQPLAGVAAAAAVASTGVVTLGSALVSIAADVTIDALRGRDPDPYRAGQNATATVVSGLRSIALTALGAVEWAGTDLVNLAGFGNDLSDGASSLKDFLCATEDPPRGRLTRGAEVPFCTAPTPPRATATPSRVPTATRTRTATPTRARTVTPPARSATPTITRSATPRPPTSATATRPAATATVTRPATQTPTPARTATRTPSVTRSPSPTRTAAAGFTILFWRNTNGATGSGAAGAQLQLGGQPDFPTLTLASSLGGAQQVSVGANRGALLYGIVASTDQNGALVPIRGPLRYGDYGIPSTLPLVAGAAPALRAGVEYVAVVTPAVFTGGTASLVFRVGD